jgi:MerR family transcriptional regulator, light-induced transcriptional regulator
MSAGGKTTIRADGEMMNAYGSGGRLVRDGGAARTRARRARLAAVVEAEIIPRLLLLAHGEAGARRPGPLPAADEVAGLVALLLAREDAAAAAHLLAVQARGVGLDDLYLGLLAPTARRLGELWEQDACDFTEVTIGMWRLHQALRDLAPAFIGAPAARGDHATALLVPLPGEQHSFGLDMLAQFFRRAGWTVLSPSLGSHAELAEALRGDAVGVVGFSVSRAGQRDATAAAIRTARHAVRREPVGVMVGGPAFLRDAHLAVLVGADATAPDAPQAVLRAESLLALHAAARRRNGADH